MASNFVVGANKVLSDTEPRFVALVGKDYVLRNILTKHIMARGYEVDTIAGQHLGYDLAALAPLRYSKQRLVHVPDGEAVSDWSWLPTWLLRAKTNRLLVDITKWKTSKVLVEIIKTKGIVIECEVPTGTLTRNKFLDLLAGLYVVPKTHLNALLIKCDWDITATIRFLEGLKQFNLPLTSTVVQNNPMELDSKTRFQRAMRARNKREALIALRYMDPSTYEHNVVLLSRWIEYLTRIKFVYTPYKPVNEIAVEVGLPIKTVESIAKYISKYSMDKINTANLALAHTLRYLTVVNDVSVMESLVIAW